MPGHGCVGGIGQPLHSPEERRPRVPHSSAESPGKAMSRQSSSQPGWCGSVSAGNAHGLDSGAQRPVPLGLGNMLICGPKAFVRASGPLVWTSVSPNSFLGLLAQGTLGMEVYSGRVTIAGVC